MKTRKEKGPNLFGNSNIISNLVNTVTRQTPTPAAAPTITPTPPPTPELETPSQETPVVDPVQDELSRQRDEVMAGNVNSAQADYFREQNEGLFMRERKGTGLANQYNKLEKITGVNPVSNREDKMTKLFGGLYGSDESRGIL